MHRCLSIIYIENERKTSLFNKKRDFLKNEFLENYQKYRVEPCFLWETDSFLIPENEENIQEVFALISKVNMYYKLELSTEIGYDEKDYQDAVAFLLRFPYGGDPYDNCYDRDEFEILISSCDSCCGNDKPEFLYLSIVPEVSKKFKSKSMGISDEYGDNLISVPMYEELISSGVGEGLFRPVYNYHNKTVGYRFYGENCILPSGVLSYPGQFEHYKCEECGREYIEGIMYNYDMSLNEAKRDFDKALKGYQISKKGQEKLDAASVGLTHEYFPTTREVLISKTMYEQIWEKWIDVEKYVIPVFAL